VALCLRNEFIVRGARCRCQADPHSSHSLIGG